MKTYLLSIAAAQVAVAPIGSDTLQIFVNAVVTIATVWITTRFEIKRKKKGEKNVQN